MVKWEIYGKSTQKVVIFTPQSPLLPLKPAQIGHFHDILRIFKTFQKFKFGKDFQHFGYSYEVHDYSGRAPQFIDTSKNNTNLKEPPKNVILVTAPGSLIKIHWG